MHHDGRYKLDIDTFCTQGVQIAISRKFSLSNFIAVMTICTCSVYVYIHKEELFLQQMYMCIPLSMTILCVGFVYQLISTIHKETLIIVSTLGMTVKRESLLSSSTKYFDLQHIEDIVIIEAVKMHSIICQLVLLPKSTSGDEKVEKVYPLFQSFQPSIEDLKTIYRQVQARLVTPNQPHNR